MLTCMWALTKLLYIVSSAVQIYSLYVFMGTEYLEYGIRRVSDIYYHGDLNVESKMFPRVTICDFEIRTLARHKPYTVECNLPINIFNGKIFLLVWYWVALVAVTNVIVFVYQVITFTAKHRYTYFEDMLLSLELYNSETERSTLQRFVYKYLNTDGYLAMKLMAYNANDLASAYVVKQLWTIFKNRNNPHSLPVISSNKSSPRTPTKQRHEVRERSATPQQCDSPLNKRRQVSHPNSPCLGMPSSARNSPLVDKK